MEQTTYIKCRSPIMTYVDPQTKFMIPRGKIVPLNGPPTKTMRRWIRRGGLKLVEEALYLRQQEHAPKEQGKDEQPAPVLETQDAPTSKDSAAPKKASKKQAKKTKS